MNFIKNIKELGLAHLLHEEDGQTYFIPTEGSPVHIKESEILILISGRELGSPEWTQIDHVEFDSIIKEEANK